MSKGKAPSLWNGDIVRVALVDSLRKLNPRVQVRNPVMFVVEVTALAVTLILLRDTLGGHGQYAGFEFQIAIWLWFTVLFANFAEAMAEGRGKAQSDNLGTTRTETQAKLVAADGAIQVIPAPQLRRDNV